MPILYPRPEKNQNLGNLPSIKSTSHPSGEKGNRKTVKLIQKVVRFRSGHPMIRQMAENILNYYQVKSHNFLDEARAIGHYVKVHMPYLRDPVGREYVQDPVMMVERLRGGTLRGDCDDMSVLIATLLKSIGHHPRLRIVKYRKTSGAFNHIYIVVYTKNHGRKPIRLSIDAILKDKPIGYEVKHQYGEEIKL